MSGQPVAGRIWAGRLRVTARITRRQTFEFISDVVREAVYFDFQGEHPEHGDTIDLSVGLCDDFVVEGGVVVLQFPAVVTVVDPNLGVEDALAISAGMVRDAVDGWYDRPEDFAVSFVAGGGCRVVL